MLNSLPFFYLTLLLAGGLFFALWGSFLGAAYYRLLKRYDLDNPQYLSLWLGRSSCQTCLKKLSWYQLIPVFSWLFQRGKCGHCQSKVSAFYPFIEVFTIALFFAHMGAGFTLWESAMLTLIASTLVIMSLIDFNSFILPDDLQLILFISWFLSLLIPPLTPALFESFTEGFMGALFTGGLLLGLRAFFLYVRKVDAIGLGDIKLASIAGLWIGIWYIPWMLLIGSILTLVGVALYTLLKKDVSLTTRLPFGPGLAMGFYVTLLIKITIN